MTRSTLHGRSTSAFALLCLLFAGLLLPALADIEGQSLREMIAGQRKLVEQSANLGEEQKSQALAKLDEAVSLLDEAAEAGARREALNDRLQKAPQTLEKLKAEYTEPGLGLSIEDIKVWTVPQLELVLKERQLKLGEMEKSLADSERELNTYLVFARSGGGEITNLQARLAEETPSLALSVNGEGGSSANVAEQLWQQARVTQARARLDWLTLQQSNLNQLIELAQLRRDVVALRVEELRQHLVEFREYLQTRREQAVAITQLVAQQARLDAPEALRSLQSRVTALVAEQSKLVSQETELDRVTEFVKRRTEEISRDRQRLQQIVELGGASAMVSSLLQKRRAVTAVPRDLTRQVLVYQEQLNDAALRQIELDEILRSSPDPNAEIERLLDPVAEQERAELKVQAQQTLTRQRELVLDLWKQYTRVITKLSTLESLTRQRLEVTRDYRTFIDDWLLWMPSTEIDSADQADRVTGALAWLVSEDNLDLLLADLRKLPSQRGFVLFLWVTGLLLMLALRRRALATISNNARLIRKPRSDRFGLTLAVIAATLALALPVPWLMVGLGLLLAGQNSGYTQLIGAGLQTAGQSLLLLSFVRQLVRSEGLARAHLGWNTVLCDQLEKQVTWLLGISPPLSFFVALGAAGVPSVFVYTSNAIQVDVAGFGVIGVAATVALLLIHVLVVHRVWRKGGAVMSSISDDPESAKWGDYHLLWFYPLLLMPVILAVVALTGFFYTAAFLTSKVGETVWFVFMLVLLRDLLLRGLYSTQRRLRFEEALRYMETIQQRGADQGAARPAEKPIEIPLDSATPNYSELGDKVRQLVKMLYTFGVLFGLWWIWREVVPAMNFLNTIEMPLSTSKLVDGVARDVPLTLGDMLTGLLLGGLALFAARNIPALLELTLLQRLPLSRASRYAVTTLTQYLVAMIGLVITFKALGLQWSSVQWLVAALSVGLGFGLQEIVANFISGIILLFEQPIRVGDVVTVENTTGTVSRIRIRATTIINWERQELVIPNKSFITGTLINWTLSDTVNRVIITVGVSYDDDTREAMRLMQEVAAEHAEVLDDPAPRVTFESFGDNSLNLLMRVYLDDIDQRLTVITELHQAILDKFRAAGLTIAFPQRDLHLDTSRPLELVLRREAGAGNPS